MIRYQLRRIKMYHYTDSGLDNIWLTNGYEEHQEDGETFVGIHDIEGLHEQIGLTIANKPTKVTSQEFKFLRLELNLSQAKLGALLDVSDQTIARWEKGEIEVSRISDVIVRGLYKESLDNDSDISQILNILSDLDIRENTERLEFEETNHSWHRKAA